MLLKNNDHDWEIRIFPLLFFALPADIIIIIGLLTEKKTKNKKKSFQMHKIKYALISTHFMFMTPLWPPSFQNLLHP